MLLDLWRGIALVDMAWVHLAAYPVGIPAAAAWWITEATRFAAGCFVLLSGATVRSVFGPALACGGEPAREARRRLLRRALLLLLVDRLACVAFELLQAGIEPVFPGFPQLGRSLAVVAFFGRAGATGGLLLLYAMLLAALPLLEWLRQRRGAAALLLSSVVVFVLAQLRPDLLHWPPWTFPLANWQALFVAGYLAAPALESPSPLRFPSMRWNCATTLLVAVLFLLRSGPELGFPALRPSWLEFHKVPLNAPELLWYLASSLFVLSWSGWLHERSPQLRRRSAWLCGLGSFSLVGYVAHLLLELPIVAFLARFDPSALLRLLALPAMAVMLVAVCRLASALRPPQRRRLLPLPAGGLAGSGLAVASLLAILLLRSNVEPLVHDEPRSDVLVEDFAADDGEGMSFDRFEIDGSGESSTTMDGEDGAPPSLRFVDVDVDPIDGASDDRGDELLDLDPDLDEDEPTAQ